MDISQSGQKPDEPVMETEAPWQRALTALGATPLKGLGWELPEVVAGVSAVRNVLESAPEWRVVKLPPDAHAMIFGFPDLHDVGSKVILAGGGEPWGRILALHRYPRWAGVLTFNANGPLPDPAADPAATIREATGRPSPIEGSLFALDGSTVYISANDRIWSWDGRRARDEGRPRGVLASLVLRWSAR
jgi:hypothetical protein